MRINKDVEKSADTLKKQKPKKKKRLLIIFGIIIAILLAVTVFVVIPNLGNIKAAWIWLTTSKSDIEVKLNENKQQQADAMVNAGLSGASTEVIDALNSGEITQEQFQEILLGRITLDELHTPQGGTSENISITEDAISALESGEITSEQFIMIAEQQMTLEQIRNEKETVSSEDMDETIATKTEDDSKTDVKPDDKANDKSDEKQSETKPSDSTTGNQKKDEFSNENNKPSDSDKNKPSVKEPGKDKDTQSNSESNKKNESSQSKPKGDTDTPKNEDKSEKTETSFTQQAIDAYKSGEITDSQFLDVGKGNITLEQAIETNKNPVQTTPQGDQSSQNKQDKTEKPDSSQKPSSEQPGVDKTPSSDASADEKIAAVVTKMYVLKGEYEGSVAGIVQSMKAEYAALPSEQRTTSAKSSIASKYMGTINAMEAQCDAQVNAIVAELRQVLTANGRDLTLADSILSTYAAEKENTKAYYLSQYGD